MWLTHVNKVWPPRLKTLLLLIRLHYIWYDKQARSAKGRRGRDVVLNQTSVWCDVAAPFTADRISFIFETRRCRPQRKPRPHSVKKALWNVAVLLVGSKQYRIKKRRCGMRTALNGTNSGLDAKFKELIKYTLLITYKYNIIMNWIILDT